ncbi:MAG TPA: MFS transporter [Usitatibacter sp.]|nr:MFS transporter [Usitatibacter sp.]
MRPRSHAADIVLLSLAAFASAASMRVTDAMLPRLASEFEVGLAQAAHVITVFAVAYGVMQMVFGPLGDKHGKLRVIGLAAMGAALATLACAFAPGYATFVAGRLFAGALCGSIIPLAMAWIGDVVPYEERQPVIARFLLGQIIGLGAGTGVGGLAAEHVQWRWPFLALAAWLLVSGLLLVRASRRDPGPRSAPGGNFLRDVGQVLSRPWARVVVASVMMEGIVLFGALAFIPTHLNLARGFSSSHAGLAMLAFALGGVGFAVFARPVVRRLGEVGLAVAGTVLLAGGLALIAWTPLAAAAPAGCLVAGLGFYMFHNTLQTNATQMSPERRGAGMALFASTFFLGQAAGVAVAGVLVEAFGAAAVLVGAALGMLPIGLGFARLRIGR